MATGQAAVLAGTTASCASPTAPLAGQPTWAVLLTAPGTTQLLHSVVGHPVHLLRPVVSLRFVASKLLDCGFFSSVCQPGSAPYKASAEPSLLWHVLNLYSSVRMHACCTAASIEMEKSFHTACCSTPSQPPGLRVAALVPVAHSHFNKHTALLTMLLPYWCPAVHPDPPTNCSAVPATALSDGSWPSSCAGLAIGAQCSANCTYGGGANVTCMTDGEWDITPVGSCAGGYHTLLQSHFAVTVDTYISWTAVCWRSAVLF